LKIGEHTKPILTPSGFLILKIEDIKKNDTKKDDLNKKIKELIRLKTNQQLNQFSNIYLNKLKMNLVVNEL
jgi:parvulin-like peptidyl-prolyl isomerase